MTIASIIKQTVASGFCLQCLLLYLHTFYPYLHNAVYRQLKDNNSAKYANRKAILNKVMCSFFFFNNPVHFHISFIIMWLCGKIIIFVQTKSYFSILAYSVIEVFKPWKIVYNQTHVSKSYTLQPLITPLNKTRFWSELFEMLFTVVMTWRILSSSFHSHRR